MEQQQASSRYSSVYEHYAGKMMKISMSVGVIWAMSSLCLAIILLLVFIQVSIAVKKPQLLNIETSGSMDWRHS